MGQCPLRAPTLGETDRNNTINSNNNHAPDRILTTNTNSNTSSNSKINNNIIKYIKVSLEAKISDVLLLDEVKVSHNFLSLGQQS